MTAGTARLLLRPSVPVPLLFPPLLQRTLGREVVLVERSHGRAIHGSQHWAQVPRVHPRRQGWRHPRGGGGPVVRDERKGLRRRRGSRRDGRRRAAPGGDPGVKRLRGPPQGSPQPPLVPHWQTPAKR